MHCSVAANPVTPGLGAKILLCTKPPPAGLPPVQDAVGVVISVNDVISLVHTRDKREKPNSSLWAHRPSPGVT